VILESKEESMETSCIFSMEKGWGIFNVLVNFELLKCPKLIFIDYLEIENLERNFDVGATI
jgi:hypothetical protein